MTNLKISLYFLILTSGFVLQINSEEYNNKTIKTPSATSNPVNLTIAVGNQLQPFSLKLSPIANIQSKGKFSLLKNF